MIRQDVIQLNLIILTSPINTFVVKWLCIRNGLQIHSMHAFSYPSKSIDGPYVDGVSITYSTPHKHLFTYSNGFSYGTLQTGARCPCAGGDDPLLLCHIITFVSQELLVIQVPQFTVLTLYGMEKDARLAIVAVHGLAHHGFRDVLNQIILMNLLKQEFVVIKSILMKASLLEI